jgi:hypothetical protein
MTNPVDELIKDINGCVNLTEEYLTEKKLALLNAVTGCLPIIRDTAPTDFTYSYSSGYNQAIAEMRESVTKLFT